MAGKVGDFQVFDLADLGGRVTASPAYIMQSADPPEKPKTLPLVVFTCQDCGQTKLFSARVMGLVD